MHQYFSQLTKLSFCELKEDETLLKPIIIYSELCVPHPSLTQWVSDLSQEETC